MAKNETVEQILERLGDLIAIERGKRGMTTNELALAIGTSRPTISRLENGKPVSTIYLAAALIELGLSKDLLKGVR